MKKNMSVLCLSMCIVLSMLDCVQARIRFRNYTSNISIKDANSKLILNKANKVTGWGEFSIFKQFGDKKASTWVEQYPDGVTISQEGSQEPPTQLTISNSNAINYGIKNNSNTIADFAQYAFTGAEKQEALDTARTTSNAFLYCCKNTSNALAYGLKNNSNALVALDQFIFGASAKQDILEYARTTSNAFLYCCKNTSNALLFGIRNNSNALINWPGGALWSIQEKEDLYETIRVNSNAFVYCCKNTSNAFSSAFKIYETHQVYTDDALEQNYVFYKAGFTVSGGKTLTINTRTPVMGEINLSDTGILQLGGALYVASDAYLTNGGIIDGNGHSLVLSCNFTIPEGQVLQITGDTIINGHGTTITLEPHAQIIVDNNVTVTIKNARIKNTRNGRVDPMIGIAGSAGRLALQNCELALRGDYYFDNGHLFIHDDVIISGTSSFVYTCSHHSYIECAGTWGFDKRTKFLYDPRVSDNSLIHMQNGTSCLFLNGSMLQAGDMGLRLSKGCLYFDNNVTLSCPTSTIIFGDSRLPDGDLDVHVLASARVEVTGSILDDSSFDTP